ncbi:MAG: hypothetical protein QW808_04200 [Desulfurococcaceae archaeon]
MDERPFLSTGSVIEDYRFLLGYMKKCKQLKEDCSSLLPTSEILSEIIKAISEAGLSFGDIIELIRTKFESSIDCDLCSEAFKEAYGVVVDCTEAKKLLFVQIAGWYVEILESLGYIKVRYQWKQ